MFTTQYMGLIVWDLGGDAYNHSQLANAFKALDTHDHNESNGRGKQIPTAGIQNDAITEAKMANNSVGSDQIINGSIIMEDLADSTILALAPIGKVIMWWRPDTNEPIPPGWVQMLGQTLTPAQHDFVLRANITLPDMTDTFPRGVGTGTSGVVAGGSNTMNLGHSHTVNAHSHTVNSHSHTVNSHAHTVAAHIHQMGDHAHYITGDGAHNHGMHSRQSRTLAVGTPTGGSELLQTLYIAGFNAGGGDALTPVDGNHAHGGGTLGMNGPYYTTATAPATDSQSPGTSSVSPATDSQSPGTSSSLGAGIDARPKNIGLMFLMKVKKLVS